jgi:hypothetical protein
MNPDDNDVNYDTLTLSAPLPTINSAMISSSILSNSAITQVVPVDRIEEILDTYDLNQVMCEYKLAEFELMKLRDEDPNYSETIKTAIANKISSDVVKKVSFTMKKDKDTDVNYFRGRAYVFTKQELIDLIKEVRK